MTYSVAIPVRSFPARQRLAKHVRLRLGAQRGQPRDPQVAVTISSGGANAEASRRSAPARGQGPGVALPAGVDRRRGPASGDTAYANTWALGAIEPHDTRSFAW